MHLQIAIGTVLILATIIFSASAWRISEMLTDRADAWLKRLPHRPKTALVLSILLVWMMIVMTGSVWAWAAMFRVLGVFDAFEPALYFALVAFTTLGFGDILLPTEWRVLGGLAAANGLLIFGLLTAVLVDALRNMDGQ